MKSRETQAKKKRIPRLDTAKFILIWMVIVCHSFWSYWRFPENSCFSWLYCLLLAYAMPMFAFISGLFIQVGEIRWRKFAETLFLCVVLNMIGALWGKWIGIRISFWSVAPVMWYLWVYAASVIVLPLIMKKSSAVGLAFSFVLSWGVCFIPGFFRLEFFGRFCGFLPFFALGAYVGNAPNMKGVRVFLGRKAPSFGAGVGLLALYAIVCSISLRWPHLTELGVKHVMFGGGIKMLAVRLFFQFIAVLMGALFILLLPGKEYAISRLGSRTLVPYLLHWYLVFSLASLVPKVSFLQPTPIHFFVMGVGCASCIILFDSRLFKMVNGFATSCIRLILRLMRHYQYKTSQDPKIHTDAER